MKITLRAARVNAGLTREEASQRSGISMSTIKRWESGAIVPRPDRLRQLCEVYQVPLDTQTNFPDTIQLGDAFQVREDGWSLPAAIKRGA